ncbi:unnamed protein product [Microthlaspi erraticum]|uniref:Reverse transcriptase zinc-binding domain-containing protein n=1 Tax=Microthlaspi erraticum TaxID=1685480 RepID=A0A6D2HR85_9BRAS|nr:unnamed protein product [Microthlaspi erraticum]
MSTNIWTDPWISLDAQCRPMGPPTEATKELRVSTLISPKTKEWNKEMIRAILPGYESQIQELRPSKSGAQDKLIWLAAEGGIYSVKTGYYAAIKADEEARQRAGDHQLEQHRGFKWIREIWQVHTTPKTRLFIWKAMWEALPVGENLRARNVNASVRCPHCNEVETTLHLLFHCTFARKVWNLVPCKQPLSQH